MPPAKSCLALTLQLSAQVGIPEPNKDTTGLPCRKVCRYSPPLCPACADIAVTEVAVDCHISEFYKGQNGVVDLKKSHVAFLFGQILVIFTKSTSVPQ